MKKLLLLFFFLLVSVRLFGQLPEIIPSGIPEGDTNGVLYTQTVRLNDNLVTFYSSGNNIYSVRSADLGATWEDAVQIGSEEIGDNQKTFFAATIGSDNRIILIYAINEDNSYAVIPLKFSWSDDEGETWSAPANVYSSLTVNWKPNIRRSPEGRLFISGRKSYLFFSDDNGISWSPKRIGEDVYDVLPVSDEELIITDNENVEFTLQRTTDFGENWTNVIKVAQLDGSLTQNPSLATDENGNFYFTFEKSAITNPEIIYDIVYTKSTDGGTTWPESGKLTEFPGQDINHIASSAVSPVVTFRSNRASYGGFWIADLVNSEDDGNQPAYIGSTISGNPAEGVKVSVNLISRENISSVNLLYSVNGEAEQSLVMNKTNQEDDIYTFEAELTSLGFPPVTIETGYEVTLGAGGTYTFTGENLVYPLEPKKLWMNVGEYNNWFASDGVEMEEGFVASQQYGMQYPAWYPYQDMQCSRTMWIGAKEFYEDNGDYSEYKTAKAGPRYMYEDSFFPVKFSVTEKTERPVVKVNGAESKKELATEPDLIDPALVADKKIYNEINSSLGLTVKREIFQFGQEYHDNYIVNKYTLVNTGNTDGDPAIERPDSTLEDVYLSFMYRLAISRQTRFLIGNGTGWGMNTMLDIRGDGVKNTADNPDDLRFQYAWHGNFPVFNEYDNVGAPVFHTGGQGYISDADTLGRLGSAQFPGILTLHADASSTDHSDDPGQPSTTAYVDSDSPLLSNSAYNYEAEYNQMAQGHKSPFHADVVEPDGNYATADGDPALGTSGGFSMQNGYGPYDIAFGDSVVIIWVEGAAGLSRENAVKIGKQFKEGEITALEKNEWVLTGKDSLIETFTRAMENYKSGWNIPQPPLPPSEFTVTSHESDIELTWTAAENSNVTGYEIYRSISESRNGSVPGQWDTEYDLAAALGADARTYTDTDVIEDVDYFYYIVAVGDPAENNGAGNTPAGVALKSGRLYTQTYIPAKINTTGVEDNEQPGTFVLYNNYPNPFNPSTTIEYYLPERSAVNLKVYNVLGQTVTELTKEVQSSGAHTVKWNAGNVSSGVYIYSIEVKSEVSNKTFSSRKKMILMK